MLLSTNSGVHSFVPDQPRIPMKEAMRTLAKVGFDAVDVNFAATIYTSREKNEPILDGENWRDTIRDLTEEIARVGLAISHTHLPFYNYGDTDHADYELRTMMMDRSIEASAIVGAKWAVIHPSTYADIDEMIEKSLIEMQPMIEKANALGVGLAIENMSRTPYQAIIEIVDEFRSRGYEAGICWDTGHANRKGINQYEGLTAIGERLKTLHVHDNFGAGDDHLPVPFGRIEWDDFYRGLREINYKGTMNYEVALSRLPLETREEMLRYLVHHGRMMIEKIGL